MGGDPRKNSTPRASKGPREGKKARKKTSEKKKKKLIKQEGGLGLSGNRNGTANQSYQKKQQ